MIQYKPTDWLPTSAKEVEAMGWESVDVILFSGDAYVDHPSFGIAVIARVLQNLGLRVAIVPQPNWRDDLRDFKKLGRPNLFFGVSGGNMDSMINHYTAHCRKRSDDAYTPAGKAGNRPDYACTVYAQIVKQLYPDVPLIIGGIEASLRRLCHYDYWSDTLKPSILIDSKADMLLYGMSEKSLAGLVALLQKGVPIASIHNLPQTAFCIPEKTELPKVAGWETIALHSYAECLKSKEKYAHNFKVFEQESNKQQAARLIEQTNQCKVIINPPYASYTQQEIDAPYALPYTRLPHPRYNGKGDIPAFEMIKNSINIHRGCFGGCSFCTISAHQGKFVQSRSEQSVIKEVETVVGTPGFNGTLTDLGGPSANMFQMKGVNLQACAVCPKASCIFPVVCPNLNTNHAPLTELYQKVAAIKGVKHVYIGSGVRYDLVYAGKKSSQEYLQQLITHHVSGRLKVAPEHTTDNVLNLMRKPSFTLFKRFKADFERINNQAFKKQQIVPYFISSHPGSSAMDMAELAAETKQLNFKLEQVQDFTPTPMTLSTTIYYTGMDPYTLKKVYVTRSKEDKQAQQNFFFWYKPQMRTAIKQQLEKLKRPDLIKKILG